MDHDLDAFFDESYATVRRAVARVAGEQDADDYLQEALARALRALRSGVVVESVPAWVTTVATNLARDGLRRAGRQTELRDAPIPDPSGVLDAVLDVRRALDDLSQRQLEAVVARYFSGLSVAETAAFMDVTTGTVKTLLHRARARIVASLGLELPADNATRRHGRMTTIDVVSVQRQLVWLKDRDRERYLSIGMLPELADAIDLARRNVASPRPVTHDLMANLLAAADVAVTGLAVTAIEHDTILAEIALRRPDGSSVSVQCRPSDGLALALRAGAAITADEGLLREVRVPDWRPAPTNLGCDDEALPNGRPPGFIGGAEGYEVAVDDTVVHGEGRSVRMRCIDEATARFTGISQEIDAAPFRERRIRFAAWLKAEGAESVVLWARADHRMGVIRLAWADTAADAVTGTSDWVQRSVALDVPREADGLRFGVALKGGGTVWVDDLSLDLEPSG